MRKLVQILESLKNLSIILDSGSPQEDKDAWLNLADQVVARITDIRLRVNKRQETVMKRPIQNIETLEIYENVAEAAKKLYCTDGNIVSQLYGFSNHAKGCKFRFLDEFAE